MSEVLQHISDTAWSVVLAVLPLAVLFLLFQALFLQLPVKEVTRILIGTLVAAAGLFLFLLGVSIAFLPFGRAIGEAFGSVSHKWFPALFGILLAFATSWGEPSVRILADQVEEASSGSIHRSLVIMTVCTGVALSMGLGMLRVSYAIPLVYLILPGYALVVALLWFSDQQFIGIAIDAGGVATGPLANTFLLAIAFGTSTAMGHDPLVNGLGLVALIALAPVISIMTLGVLIRWKQRP